MELFRYRHIRTPEAKERLPLGPNPPLSLQEESLHKQQGGSPEPLLEMAPVPLLNTLFKPNPTFLVHPQLPQPLQFSKSPIVLFSFRFLECSGTQPSLPLPGLLGQQDPFGL